MNKPVFLLSLVLLSAIMISTVSLEGFGNFENKISNYHIENAAEDTEASNIVTTIVWDYRAYDTLGEETVLFTATLGICALFKKYRKGRGREIKKEPRFLFPDLFGGDKGEEE